MKSKVLPKQPLLLVIVFSVLAIFVTLFYYFIAQNSVQIVSAPVIENVGDFQQQEGGPVRLKIPSIKVDAYVEHVGLTPDGAMDVPKDPNNVAWFKLGPRPGESGSAVIAGHYDWKNNMPAIFNNLHKLSEGDKIYIEYKNGETITFVVRDVSIYDKDDDASDVFGSSDGKVHLNLITCGGAWNKAEETYSDRLIVFADKE